MAKPLWHMLKFNSLATWHPDKPPFEAHDNPFSFSSPSRCWHHLCEHTTGRRVAFLFGIWPTRDKMIKRLARARTSVAATGFRIQDPGHRTLSYRWGNCRLPMLLFGNDSAKLLMMITMWLDEWLFGQVWARGFAGLWGSMDLLTGWLLASLPAWLAKVLLLSSTLKFLKWAKWCRSENVLTEAHHIKWKGH